MKPKLILLTATILICLQLQAQSVEEQMTKKHVSCRDVYLNAVELLPKLYRNSQFDSMEKALQIWKDACDNDQKIKYSEILLDIQQSKFSVANDLDTAAIDLLLSYATAFADQKKYPYFFVEGDAGYFKFISTWAKFLLQGNKLDANETFICKVFSGEITNPEKEIRSNKDEYPDLYVLLKQNDIQQRNGFRGSFTVVSGIWMPTGNAKILGNHPNIGVQFGSRDNRNEIDFTLQFKFNKTVQPYTVKRNDVLYDRNYFFGGYLGLDYSRYLISSTKFEAGVIGGLGFDGFDIANSDQSYDYLKPTSINSFNANAGLRLSYFLSPTFYLGLISRYNFVNYGTGGGSNLNGDAVTIDFVLGFNTNPVTRARRFWH